MSEQGQLSVSPLKWNYKADMELLMDRLATSSESELGTVWNLISTCLRLTQKSKVKTGVHLGEKPFTEEPMTQITQHCVRNPMEIDVILREFLSHVPLDSLKTFRLVNSNWNSSAIPWIQKKMENVLVKPENFASFCADFEDAEVLPFTKLEILLEPLTPEQCKLFFSKHGSVLRELKIQECLPNTPHEFFTDAIKELCKLRNILGLVPNLKKLSLDLEWIPKVIQQMYCKKTNFHEALDVTLSHVEYLQISSKRIPFSKEYLECMFSTSFPNVKIVELGDFKIQDWEGFAEVMKNRNVHTVHCPDVGIATQEKIWRALAAENAPKLKEISMVLGTARDRDNSEDSAWKDLTESQQELLNSQSGSLEVLTLTINTYKQNYTIDGLPRLQFPVLPNLKKVTFRAGSVRISGRPYPLIQLESRQVPNLRTVYIDPELVFATIFANERFENVEDVNLGLGSWPVYRIKTRFPNLKKLTNLGINLASLWSPEETHKRTEFVVTKLGHVTDLGVKIIYNSKERKNINLFISGIPSESEWAVSQLAERVGYESLPSWIVPPRPSLRLSQLFCLKRLVLTFDHKPTATAGTSFARIDEIGVYMTFLRLSSKLELTLRGDFSISDELAAKLTGHFQTIFITPTSTDTSNANPNSSSNLNVNSDFVD